METFITILAYIFAAATLIRILAVTLAKRSAQEQLIINAAEAMGQNVIMDTIRWPVIIFVVCVSWIVSTFI